ncbi:PREDICTED: uncharacterized protein LOC106119015 isoform X2 [Papilio xuthus]|uniref:Uncharacterized protein LOC106119015 isoform X1 n=2 Tax=Papilio xuthus TaxID=66420 RepID=A0AAJ6ZC01_PAPXU|nr:PREDICTED: uncharacterized protein LOC106119015 isoform X1 [Papilio xuthus]XP_013169301.1 PREDICTED: uncharacterized protein LOC106119015 isoform X2 [Papilio xuthus]
MSFVDLATIALHRRNEMEARIKVFSEKCDHAITDINKLKTQAKNFVHQLNCDPADLKERFLNCMKNLDEFTYLITDFNLALSKLGSNTSIELTPVQDTSITALPARPSRICTPYNLIDVLTEPTPSTSNACPNQCPTEKPLRRKLSQQDQVLIAFSSPSPSSSSGSINVRKETTEKEVQCELVEELKNTADGAPSPFKCFNLPAQTILTTDQEYPAKILSVDGVSFWVTTDNYNELYNLLIEMSEYYKTNFIELNPCDVRTLTYCACYDHKRDKFFRGLFIRLNEESNANYVEVFLVDTGEVLVSSLVNVQPLPQKFCKYPPFARCCYLAGIEFLVCNDKDYIDKLESVLKQFINKHCIIIVDDNSSEALGVFVRMLPSGTFLNNLLIDQGLAYEIVEEKSSSEVKIERGPPELVDPECDINDCPEFEDPVEAVTGYHNRDEADICKHYKGGPEKTCFKGARCTKKHILKHPEGWTLDRVAVAGKCLPLPLPAPGAWLQVYVCHVVHYDRFYVQLPQETRKVEASSFGVVLPPSTLEALVRDMNSPASRMAYKPLKMAPALGELVAALYPADEKWYRARVVSSTRVDQNIEVVYIDYGNTAWVLEDGVRQLAARHWALPAQAVPCALAGVRARTQLSRDWADARALLSALIADKTISARVISRDYDGMTLELFDNEGESIAERLAESKLVEVTEYAISDDSAAQQRVVVP